MGNFSVTQASNFTAFASVIVLIVKAVFKVEIPEGDVVTVIASITALVGVISSFYQRYKRGDITVAGVRK